jgi:acyl-CoA dehydrogenase
VIDFEIPAETKAVRAKARAFVKEHCVPAEAELENRGLEPVLAELRAMARAQGLWCPFIPRSTVAWVCGHWPTRWSMELSESIGAHVLNTQGPDDATMLTLLEHGTDFQKEKFLEPLLEGKKRICSMTERAAGADATGMQTSAVLDGDHYVLNSEKWFSSSASVADIALVMAETDPDAARHRQFSTFLVELPNPATGSCATSRPCSRSRRSPSSSAGRTPRSGSRTWWCRGRTCSEGAATSSRWASTGSPMAGCVTACTTSPWRSGRSTWRPSRLPAAARSGGGSPTVRACGGRSPTALYMARLMLLHVAYKAENGMDLRQENSIAKVFLAHMVHKVVDTRCSSTARSAAGTRRWRGGTPVPALNAWSTVRTRCTAGASGAT